MEALMRDLRYAFRILVKNPGFTVIAIVTLALGIGANSTILSWINSTLLDPIPGITRTGDLVTVMRGEPSEHPTPPFSYPDYVDLREGTRSLAGFVAYHDNFVSITGSGKPERIYAALTSANYFNVLGEGQATAWRRSSLTDGANRGDSRGYGRSVESIRARW